MDLEMTGLDPAHNVIVEIATIVTDDELNIVAEGPDLVIGATPQQLEDMDDVQKVDANFDMDESAMAQT